MTDIAGARVLLKLGDSVTTDHISPAGSIRADSPAGKYLAEHGVERKDFNSYGSRRGNHEVMIRGTFANIRLRNQIAPVPKVASPGDFTRDGETDDAPEATVYDAAMNYAEAGTPLVDTGRQGVRLRVVAGLGRQGHRAARRQGGDRGVLRADPPVQPDRDGRAAAAVPEGRERRDAGADRHRDVRHLRRRRSSMTAEVPNQVQVQATPAGGGEPWTFTATVRIDTPGEAEYYRHGGIMQYVLRSLLVAPPGRGSGPTGTAVDPFNSITRREGLWLPMPSDFGVKRLPTRCNNSMSRSLPSGQFRDMFPPTTFS